jgi:hypothetical protein
MLTRRIATPAVSGFAGYNTAEDRYTAKRKATHGRVALMLCLGFVLRDERWTQPSVRRARVSHYLPMATVELLLKKPETTVTTDPAG